MWLQILFLVLSLVILYYGAEFALDAAEKVGVALKLSPLVIGLVIVGFGTSLPEFFVSQLASFRGHSDIAMGNIIGSNIANLFLVMGISGLLVRLDLSDREIRKQLIFHFVLVLFTCGIFYRGRIDFLSTIGFVCFFIYYMISSLKQMKEDASTDKSEITLPLVMKLGLGFLLLYGGGELLVHAGTNLGAFLGVSQYVISAIFVAFGTSFPELITALIACFKKKDANLITGNIIGSNIFNIAFVLGSLGPYQFSIAGNYKMELALLVCAAIFLILLSLFKWRFFRPSGLLFLMGYAFIVSYWLG